MYQEEILNDEGEVEDELLLRRIVFFGGVQPSLRKHIWPFLLQRFPYKCTRTFREQCIQEDMLSYEELNKRRLDMSEEEKDEFWKRVQSTIEKDVPRTDRTNPFFSGDSNENVLIMKRILLNYAIYNPCVGYTQVRCFEPLRSQLQRRDSFRACRICWRLCSSNSRTSPKRFGVSSV